jgi:DNA-binding CsgD family transcriptional regulator
VITTAPIKRRPRDPRIWTATGQLRDTAVQEIARRLQAGEGAATIAVALNISPPVTGRKCREIAAALGLPTAASQREAFCREVADLAEQGLTDQAIADQLGHPLHKIEKARTRAAGPKYRLLRLTAEEHARIDAMARDGFSAPEIAATIGCSRSLAVARIAAIPPGDIKPTRPPCACGKPAGHGGRCRAIMSATMIRERLLAGATCADIAREVGLRPTCSFKSTYCQPVIDQMTDEGLRCECGQPYGHPYMCKVTGARLRGTKDSRAPKAGKPRQPKPIRTRLGDDVLADIKRRLRAGESGTSIAGAIGANPSTVNGIIRRLRSTSNYPLKPCACGRPARHPGGCAATSPQAIEKLERVRIENEIRAGALPRMIADRMGISLQAVLKHSQPLRDQLYADGIACACGKKIGHPEWCVARWDEYGKARGPRPLPEAKVGLAKTALLRGDRGAEIAAAIGVGIRRVWALRHDLTDDERAQRSRAIRARLAISDVGGTDIMARIDAVLSRRLDPALRDDIAGELHLAVLEGRVEVEQIGEAARSFVSKAMTQWQSAFGPRSLNQTAFADGSRTLADTLEDQTTADQIDQMELGGTS